MRIQNKNHQPKRLTGRSAEWGYLTGSKKAALHKRQTMAEFEWHLHNPLLFDLGSQVLDSPNRGAHLNTGYSAIADLLMVMTISRSWRPFFVRSSMLGVLSTVLKFWM